MLFQASEWRIAGSSGETVTVGTPNLEIQIGGGRLNLPIRNTRTGEMANLVDYGTGISAGISALEAPLTDWVNGSISTSSMPSDGIGTIFRKATASGKPYTAKDLTGVLTVFSGGGSISATSDALALALWQNFQIAEYLRAGVRKCDIIKAITNTALVLNPCIMPVALLNATHAVGLFTGVAATTNLLGAGLSVFSYHLSV